LPCREKEHNEIMTFVSQGLIRGGSPSSLYIAGMPGFQPTFAHSLSFHTILFVPSCSGTGKTASVRQVIKELKSQNESVRLNSFADQVMSIEMKIFLG
jgi:Cdc6-like AAA superfamily ATPase